LPLEVFTERNFICSRRDLIEIEFYFEKLKNRSLSNPLGDLGVTYALVHL